jgi:predicted Zn-dependent protease
MLVDTFRETGEFLVFDESGPSLLDAHEAAASTASALLARKLSLWPEITLADRAARANEFLQRARVAIDDKRNGEATEYLNQALAYNPSQNEAQVLLGDNLMATDPVAAAQAYRRALDAGTGSGNVGQTWEKLAGAYATARDWPRTLDAGRRSLALNWDTASVRQAMATAQFGRAELFRRADQTERAEEAELQARQHLDKARELAPDDPAIIRLLAEQLVGQKRYREAVEALDRLMIQVPPDAALLTLYATALTDRGMRDSDAFIAWARVWKMSGTQSAPMNAVRYRRIAEGFDKYVSDGATMAAQLTTGVSAGTLPRESALLQLQKILEDMQTSEAAIRILQPPGGAQNEANQASRVFAASTIVQAVNQHRVYVETGDELYRSRANELHRQAIMQLNVARGAR